MKKFIALMLIVTLSLMLCACGVLLCHALIYPPVREVFPAEKCENEPEESTEA